MSKGCQFAHDSCLGPSTWISGSGGVSALCSPFPVPCTTGGLKGPFLIRVPDWSNFCFSAPLPISPDAACLPRFSSAAQVFRRAETAASPFFFSATVGGTGGRRTQCGVFSSTPQVGTRTHFQPLCMPGYIVHPLSSLSLFSLFIISKTIFERKLLFFNENGACTL